MNHADGFSLRLAEAMRAAGLEARPSILEKKFNLSYSGARPVTYQTARKWLRGQAIPTQDKLETLARWLNVSAHYLRFGEGSPGSVRELPAGWDGKFPQDAITLAERYCTLKPEHRRIARAVLDSLYDLQSEDEASK